MGKPAGADGGKGIDAARCARTRPNFRGRRTGPRGLRSRLPANGGCVVCNAAGPIRIPRVGPKLEKAVNRSEKAEAIVELNQIFKDANLMVVTRQTGLTVQEVTDLRRKVRAAGASYKVAKNRLTFGPSRARPSRRSDPCSRVRLPSLTPRIRSLRRRSSRPSPRTTRS